MAASPGPPREEEEAPAASSAPATANTADASDVPQSTIATSSKVTLDHLRTLKTSEARADLKRISLEHAGEIQDFYVLHVENGNTAPTSVPEVPLIMPDLAKYRDGLRAFYQEHRLDSENLTEKTTHFPGFKITSSNSLRRKITAELGTTQVTPKGKDNKAKVEAAKAAKDLKVANQAARTAARAETIASNKAAATNASATSVSPTSPLSSRRKLSVGASARPLSPPAPAVRIESVATPPPGVAPKATKSAVLPAPEVVVASPSVSASEDGAAAAVATTSEPQLQEKQPSPSQPSTTLASQTTVPATQSSLLTVPPSQPSQPTLSQASSASEHPLEAPSATPLHATLQSLAPNPLSVTYASSLRPLPPDPFRKYTGCGVGGGANHHRQRKPQQLNSSKSGLTAPAGPAGVGHTDLWRWYVRSRASPGAGLVGKADKCLMTKDWRVAFSEQRFLRAMARIEKLKEAGNWSFRQLRKQKGPVVRRGHWDYTLEEMKWMQTDFREERRWKMAVARQLAKACRAWKKAKTPEARAAMCVKVVAPRLLPLNPAARIKEEEVEDDQMLPGTAVMPDLVDDDVQDETMADGEATAIKSQEHEVGIDGSADAEVDADADGDADADAEPDAEADGDADGEADADADADGEADADADGEAEADADDDAVAASFAMAQASAPSGSGPRIEIVRESRTQEPMPELSASENLNPLKRKEGPDAGFSESSDAAPAMRTAGVRDETLAEGGPTGIPMSLITTLRAPVFSMDVSATVVAPSALLEAFDIDAAAEMLGIDAKDMQALLNNNADLSISTLFPELPEYAPPSEPEAGKVDKRWDEGSLNLAPRLTQVSRLLDAKPILVSTLDPARNRAKGKWLPDSDWVLSAKLADPTKGVSRQEMEALQLPTTTIFARRSNKPTKDPSLAAPVGVVRPREPEIRSAQMFWSAEEDAFLMRLYQQYGANWTLIADIFNSTRLTVITDRRESWDCYDRWDRITKAAAQGQPPPPPPQLPPVNPPTSGAAAATPGEKTEKAESAPVDESASPVRPPAGQVSSIASKREKLIRKLTTKFEGSRKRMRHSNILEVMRKNAKRRDTNAKPVVKPGEVQKVNLNCHETHITPKGGQIPTPGQLSALKADRDEAQVRQFYLYQQRQLQEQQQRAAAAQAAAQAQAQQQQRNLAAARAGNSGQGGQQQAGQSSQGQTSTADQSASGIQGQSQGSQQQQQQAAGSQQARPPQSLQSQGRPGMAGGARPPAMGVARPPGNVAGRPGTPSGGAGGQQPGVGSNAQRMTPQQQAALAAQIQGQNASQQSFNNPTAQANRPPGNVNGNNSNTGAGSSGATTNSAFGNTLAGILGGGGLTLQQLQQSLQTQLGANFNPEQLHNLSMQLFRTTQQQQQQQQAAAAAAAALQNRNNAAAAGAGTGNGGASTEAGKVTPRPTAQAQRPGSINAGTASGSKGPLQAGASTTPSRPGGVAGATAGAAANSSAAAAAAAASSVKNSPNDKGAAAGAKGNNATAGGGAGAGKGGAATAAKK